MNEIAVKRHSFDLAKNRLKEFSEKTEAELEIDKVQTDGGFLGLGDHKVTGYELNRRLETIQEHFIAVNTTNNKVIKEFREVYNALDALDKDYITSIVANVKAIEKTSNDVRVQQGILKQHNEKLANQQSKLDAHQAEIEKNVVNISKIVAALKVFKEKLEGYRHLTDIDKIWNDCKTIQNEIRVVSDSITKFSKKATEDIATANNKNKALSDQVNRDIITLRNEAKSFKEFFSDLSEKLESTANLLDTQIPVIQETASFVEHLKTVAHIDDVDSMWDDINKSKENFGTIENSLQYIEADILKMQKHLDEIDSFVAILNDYTHLQDIDNMWDDLDVCKTNIEKINRHIQAHQNELNTLATTSAEHKEAIAALFKNLADAEEYAVDSRNLITELGAFRAKVSALNHLMEIDKIWKQTEDHQIRINRVEQEGKSHTDKLNKLEQADDKMRECIDSNAHNISVLEEYKDKLCGISHLDDVDSTWKNVEEHTSKLVECERRDADLAKNLADAEEYAVDSRNLITELEAFRAKVSALNHLMEIDKIWKQTEDHQIRINRVEQESKSHTDKLNKLEQADDKMRECIDSNTHNISVLEKYKDKLCGISHLDDVDSTWKNVEEHTSKLVECETRDADLAVTIQKNKDEVNENIEEAVQTANAAIESLTKKVKYAYWIAGGSAGLAIIELILLFMKVI